MKRRFDLPQPTWAVGDTVFDSWNYPGCTGTVLSVDFEWLVVEFEKKTKGGQAYKNKQRYRPMGNLTKNLPPTLSYKEYEVPVLVTFVKENGNTDSN